MGEGGHFCNNRVEKEVVKTVSRVEGELCREGTRSRPHTLLTVLDAGFHPVVARVATLVHAAPSSVSRLFDFFLPLGRKEAARTVYQFEGRCARREPVDSEDSRRPE